MDTSSNTEVGQQDSAIRRTWVGHQDVRWLYVTMQEVPLVGIVERTGDRRHDVAHILRRHPMRIAVSEQLRRVGTVDVIHRNPQLAVLLTSVVDSNDVRVPKGRGDIGFAGKALTVFTISTDRGRKHFQRFEPWQPRVLGKVHLPHPTRPQQANDPVASEYFPLSDRHSGILSSVSPAIRKIDVGSIRRTYGVRHGPAASQRDRRRRNPQTGASIDRRRRTRRLSRGV